MTQLRVKYHFQNTYRPYVYARHVNLCYASTIFICTSFVVLSETVECSRGDAELSVRSKFIGHGENRPNARIRCIRFLTVLLGSE